MKKITIVLLLLGTYSVPLYPLPGNVPAIQRLKQIVCTYADHALLTTSHIAGKLAVAKIALLSGVPVHSINTWENDIIIQTEKGSPTVGCDLEYVPRIKIPYAIATITPDFASKKRDAVNNLVETSGPVSGLIGCYLRLKSAQILNEYYNSNKTLKQSIKDGLAKPFYQGHSPRVIAIVGLHAAANIITFVNNIKNYNKTGRAYFMPMSDIK